jgi:hypothetical protein
MIWEGLSDHDLCELLKDPKQNGGRNVGQIVEHMHIPLVLWGWSPGEGLRQFTAKSFSENVNTWASKGSGCQK